jgi:hypothetical protein
MGRLEEMRAAVAKGRSAKPQPAPPPEPEPPKPAPVPEKVEVAKDVVITFACGHRIGCHYFKCRQCEACAGRARKIKRREKHERYEKARLERLARTPAADIGRLPPGSRKVLEWDGANWFGTLTVPGCPVEFRATAPGEKGCYHALHDEYVRWRDRCGTADPRPEPAPTEGT